MYFYFNDINIITINSLFCLSCITSSLISMNNKSLVGGEKVGV